MAAWRDHSISPTVDALTAHQSSMGTMHNSSGRREQFNAFPTANNPQKSLRASSPWMPFVVVTKELLEDDVFASTSRARLQFPELFQTLAAQEAEREASEAEIAKAEAEAVQGVVPCSDNEWDGDAVDDEPNTIFQVEAPEQGNQRHTTGPRLAIPPVFATL
jgi:hypothetical protein